MSSKRSITTRQISSVPLFGTEEDLDPDNALVLPTYKDVIRCFQSARLKLKNDGVKQPSKFAIAAIVARKIELIWHRASLPVVSNKRIIDMIVTYHGKYQSIIKPLKNRNTPFFKTKLSTFKNDADRLFDICSCKCVDNSSCKCERLRKVPQNEVSFLNDQRNERQMVIGRVDIQLTKKLAEKHNRTERLKWQFQVSKENPEPCSSGLQQKLDSTALQPQDEITSSSAENLSDEQYICSYDQNKQENIKNKQGNLTQMRVSLLHTARAADLTGVSNRAAAKIATAVLEDINLVSERKSELVVDKNKIRRALAKNREKVEIQRNAENMYLEGLYFDGRKDQTLFQLEGRRVKKLEEHISLIQEPGSQYFGHVSVKTSSKAADLANGLISFINERQVDMSKLNVIGCDGTNTNTGWKGGVIRLLEVHLGKISLSIIIKL